MAFFLTAQARRMESIRRPKSIVSNVHINEMLDKKIPDEKYREIDMVHFSLVAADFLMRDRLKIGFCTGARNAAEQVINLCDHRI